MITVTAQMQETAKAIKNASPMTKEDAILTIDLSKLTADSLATLIRALESAAGSADGRYDVEGSEELYDAASNAEFYALMTSVE